MKKIKISMLLICMLFIAIIRITIIPQSFYKIYKVICIILSTIYLLTTKNNTSKIDVSCMMMLIGMIISSIVSYNCGIISNNNLINAVIYCTLIFIETIMISISIENESPKIFIKSLYSIVFIYTIMSIISVLMINVNQYQETLYFCGNKFATGLVFILFQVFLYLRYRDLIKKSFIYKMLFLFISFLFVILEIKMGATTILLGNILVIIALSSEKKLINIIENRTVLILLIILFAFFPYFLNYLLNNQFIIDFITNTLGESLTLNGRTIIYDKLLQIIIEKPVLGYGYGNDMVTRMVGFGNSQNGLIEVLINYGLLGVFLFLIYINQNIRKKPEKEEMEKVYPLYVYLLVLIVCSTVEITYGSFIFLIIPIIKNMNDYYLKDNKRE